MLLQRIRPLFLSKKTPPVSTNTKWLLLGLGLLVLILLGTTTAIIVGVKDAFVNLPMLLIGGIVVFLITLSLVVVIFKRLELSDSRSALGLPEGSIRAFIALTLILLFFILANSIFGTLSSSRTIGFVGLTEAERNARSNQIIQSRPRQEGNRTVYDGLQTDPQSQASHDVGKQLLTTVSTLVVAIAAFYFGAQSVQQATVSVQQPQPPGAQPPGAQPPAPQPQPPAPQPPAPPTESRPESRRRRPPGVG